MKASKKDIVEIVGIFAVVASLIFVGMQLVLDRRVALAEQYFDRAESAKSDRRAILESDDLMRYYEESWALGWRPSFWDENWEIARRVEEGTISTRSVIAAILDHQLAVIGYDNVYFQYQQGLLDEEMWNELRNGMKRGMARDELTRAVFQQRARTTIRPVVEELIREIESELDAADVAE